MNRIFFLFTFLQICSLGYSQTCGTFLLGDQITLEGTVSITVGTPTQSLPQINKDFSVSIYITKNASSDPGITEGRIQSLIDSLNILFSPINVRFHICSFNYINNYQLDNLTNLNVADLTTSYFTKNTINIYFVSSLTDIYGNLTDNYTYFPATVKDFIFLKKNALYIDLAHQAGHFFGLYHTYETAFDTPIDGELVARTNCTVRGDLCCDTEADPNITGLYDSNCIYIGQLKDKNGDFYRPSAQNIMSLGAKKCKSYFTRTQYLRLVYYFNNQKNYLR